MRSVWFIYRFLSYVVGVFFFCWSSLNYCFLLVGSSLSISLNYLESSSLVNSYFIKSDVLVPRKPEFIRSFDKRMLLK